MMLQQAEQLPVRRFNSLDLLDPDCQGFDMYATQAIPPHLRTLTYDQQLATGTALLPGEEPYDPNGVLPEDRASYAERWQRISAVRNRIQQGPDFAVRTLLGGNALRHVLGGPATLTWEELVARQIDAIGHIQDNVRSGRFVVGLVGRKTDLRSVSSGDFSIVHYRPGADRTGMLKEDIRRSSIVTADATMESHITRAQQAFDNLWRQSTTEPTGVIAGLDYIARSLKAEG